MLVRIQSNQIYISLQSRSARSMVTSSSVNDFEENTHRYLL